MNKEKLLKVFRESYENKDKIDKEKIKKFIEETTPFINELDKDLDYYRVLYYRLALVLELDLEVKCMLKVEGFSKISTTSDIRDCLIEIDGYIEEYKEDKTKRDELLDILSYYAYNADKALVNADATILNYVDKYINALEVLSE